MTVVFRGGALVLMAMHSACLLLAEPPPGVAGTDTAASISSTGESTGEATGGGSSSDTLGEGDEAWDLLYQCCERLASEDDWVQETCYDQVVVNSSTSATALCNYASLYDVCVDLACQVGCALPSC
jgi:hypothetical protein